MSQASMSYDKPTAIRIRDFLVDEGMTIEGAYGMMANIYCESGFRSNNLQNSSNKSLHITDEEYVVKVDNGSIDFCTHKTGFGLCQWTSLGRRTNLFNFAKSQNKSIGDETMQLNFLMQELNTSYKNVLNVLKTSNDISECTKYVMLKFERPANQSEKNQNKRASYGLQLYEDLEETKEDDKMAITIGHASIDERGKSNSGASGDQTGKEVCTRSYYLHTKGWYLLRPKNVAHANAIAEAMLRACNNDNIGYDQSNRLGVIKYGTNSNVKTECDCSSLVRQCVIEGTGIDAGNFTTATEKSMLLATGLFENAISVTSSTQVYNGDILVTKTKGHTVIVVSGSPRISTSTTSTYTKIQCVKDIQSALGGLTVDGLCGTNTLAKLPTISKTKNSKHKIVQYVQRYLNSLGYECGTVDSIFGTKTHNAVILYQKRSGLVADGIIGKNTWKKLIGM